MSHRASLDVSLPVLKAVTGWVARHRRRPRTRPAQRAGTVHSQVILVLRWLRHRLDLRLLARDAGVSIATAYRYVHEGLDVIAVHAPALADVLNRVHAAGLAFLEVNILQVALAIGLATFLMVTLGVMVGRVLGNIAGRWAEAGGGLLLIGIGAAILHEHLSAVA